MVRKRKDEQVRELRRRGLELVAHDQFLKAAAIYAKLHQIEPEEGDWARRAAECFWHLKDERAQLRYSILAAEAFCDGGFLLKAIAMCKVVLNLDPAHVQTQQRLALLYAQRPGAAAPSSAAASTSETELGPSAAESPDKKPSEQRDPRRERARLAAAAALRQIRAQRQAHHESLGSTPSHPEGPPPSADPSLSSPPSLNATPQTTASSPSTAQVLAPLAFAPKVPAIALPDPSYYPAAPSAPSLQALSLRAHLPSIRRSLTPASSRPAYCLALSRIPPPDLESTSYWEGLHDTRDIERFSQHLDEFRRADSISIPNLPASNPPSTTGVLSTPSDEEPIDTRLSLAPVTPGVAPGEAHLDGQPELATDPEEAQVSNLEAQLLAQFEGIPLFSALSHDTLVQLINALRLMDLQADQVLFDEGDLADAMYVVTDGRLAAQVTQPDGAVLTLAELREGDFFGEIGLLSDQPRQARVRALTACHLLRLERHVVTQLMQSDATFLSTLVEFLRERLVGHLIQTSPLFASLPFHEREDLALRFEFLELDEDTVLIEPGQRPAGLYVLLAGAALAYNPKAHPQLVRLGPGAIFGEGPLLRNEVSHTEVCTTGKSFALCLDAKQFRELMMTHPTVLEYVASLETEGTQEPSLGDHVTLF